MRCLVGSLFVLLVACGGEAECEDAAFQCDGDVLQECVEGAWEDAETCGAGLCNAEAAACDEAAS